MAHIVFYEKPGCISNTRQKRLLTDSGHTLEVRNLLTEDWTPARLRPYFAGMAVQDWFNKTAPRVKSAEVAPETISEEDALREMCRDPILIRRPLMATGGITCAGFDQDAVDAWIGLTLADTPVTDDCPRVAG